ncbi:unnamed protein product [Lactuca virosa]|uniref:Uncharacterized protein n=1 Tax=Lactuca virosa TaxID=75947 RepID=A0AAU9NC92_9ASTR|nr:unnamed protein product [Lactuca virosa]
MLMLYQMIVVLMPLLMKFHTSRCFLAGTLVIVAWSPLYLSLLVFAFIFQKGSPLVEDVSREIAKIRLDGTLGSLENKWYENRISLPSRNSTIPHAVTLDKFGGLFIISAATSTLTFMVSLVHLIRIRLRQFQRIINHFR